MNLENGISFIWENARHLERAIFAYRFANGPSAHILQILSSYQNEDGGFGHALEPDLRAPDSHPLFVEFALHTLYACNLRDAVLAGKVGDFLAQHADLQQGIPTLFPSARLFPRASHWHSPAAEAPSFDRLNGLVGLLQWQGIAHPWLARAHKVLRITGTGGRDWLVRQLRSRGVEADDVPVYGRELSMPRPHTLARIDTLTRPQLIVSHREALLALPGLLGSARWLRLAAAPMFVSSDRLAALARSMQCARVHVADSARPVDLLAAISAWR